MILSRLWNRVERQWIRGGGGGGIVIYFELCDINHFGILTP
jgi:hypothetical protein